MKIPQLGWGILLRTKLHHVVLRALLCLLGLALRRGLALGRLFDGLLFRCFLFRCHGNQLLSIFTVGFYLPIGARIRVN